jgi:predicted NBD/HSP70 family sugar kinase
MISRRQPARQTSLRAHNLALVFGEVVDHGPASRAAISAATGLTKASVSSLVNTLIDGRLLTELGPMSRGRTGRPGSVLGLAPDGPVGIGLELNVDYLATVTVDLTGAVLNRELIASDLRVPTVDEVLGDAAAALRRVRDRAPSTVAGIGVAVPGLVDTDRALLRLAPNLGWRDVPVLAEIRGRAGVADLPMQVDNEANLAALAELWCGRHRTPEGGPLTTFVHVSGEVGVGSGIVIRGALFRGARGFGGEIGHLPVRADGPRCRCGAVGCLEQAAGLEAILRAAGPAGGTNPDVSAPDGGRRLGPEAELADLIARAEAGRPEVVEAIGRAGTWLGVAVSSLLNIVDVDAVILGGIYARLASWLRDPLVAELDDRVLTAGWQTPRIHVSRLGADAAVRGAATAAIRSMIADPAPHLARRRSSPADSGTG